MVLLDDFKSIRQLKKAERAYAIEQRINTSIKDLIRNKKGSLKLIKEGCGMNVLNYGLIEIGYLNIEYCPNNFMDKPEAKIFCNGTREILQTQKTLEKLADSKGIKIERVGDYSLDGITEKHYSFVKKQKTL